MDDHRKTKAELIAELNNLRARLAEQAPSGTLFERNTDNTHQQIEHLAHLGSWELNFENNRLHFSKTFYDVYELDYRQELTFEQALEFYSPESRNKLSGAIQKLETEGVPFDLVLEIKTRSGKHRWVRAMAEREVVNGKVKRLYGVMQDITATLKLERELLEKEQTYREIFETNQSVKLIIDPVDGRIVQANQAACTFYGYSRDKLLTLSILDINTSPRKVVLEKMAAAKSGRQLEFRFKHRLANGTIRDVEVFSGPVTMGSRILLYSIIHDVTDRLHQEKLNDVLFKITRASSEAESLEKLFEEIHKQINRLFDAHNFYIALYDTEKRKYHFPYSKDAFDKRSPRTMKKLKNSLTDKVRRSNKPLLIEKEAYMRLVKKGEIEPIGQPAVTWMGVPFVNITGISGVVCAQTYDEHTRYNRRDLETLEFVTSHIGWAIRQKKQELKVIESEERYRILVDQSPLAIGIHQDGKIVFVNDQVVKLFAGKNKSDFIGRQISDFIHPDSRESVAERQERLKKKEILPSKQHKLITFDGQIKEIETLAVAISLDGKQAVQFVLSDVTEQNKTHILLREMADSYRALFDNATSAIYILDTDGRFLDVNRSVQKLYGYSKEHYIGKTIEELHQGKKQEIAYIKNHLRKVARGKHQKFEYKGINKKGQPYTEELSLYLSQYFGRDVLIAFGLDITKRKKTEENLRLSEQSFKSLFNNASDAIYIQDDQGRFLDVNKSVEKLYGYPKEYFIGKTPIDLTDEGLNDLDAIFNLFRDTFSTGTPHTFEFWGKRKNGEYFLKDVRINRSLYFSQPVVIAFAQDITQRKKQEQALVASEKRFRTLIQDAPVGIGIFRKGTFTFVNQKLVQIFRYNNYNALIGKSLDILIQQGKREEVTGLISKLNVHDKRHNSLETTGIRADGSSFPIQLQSSMITLAEGPAILVFINDISKIKEEEQKRLDLEKQVQQAQKLKSLGVLAGGIAHDFNNLLTGIMGNTGLAMMDIPQEAQAQGNLLKIEKIATQAAELCNQMLAYSGKGNFVVKAANLNEVIRDITSLLDVSLSKKIKIHYHLSDPLPNVEIDVQQINQVILNLVTNAGDAIGNHSGIISLYTGVCHCTEEELRNPYIDYNPGAGEYIKLEVHDTGCGMDAATLEKLFEPFFTTKFTGRGLGLSAVLGIIRRHKGSIQIESTPGKGTLARIFLPVSTKDIEPEKKKENTPGAWRGQGHILVADDEDSIREMCKPVLENLGYNVTLASNGHDAVELFRKSPSKYDFILLDLTMPVLNGEEAYEHMKQIRDDVRIIISSGYSTIEADKRFADKDIAGFLHKPYTIEQLKELLQNLHS